MSTPPTGEPELLTGPTTVEQEAEAAKPETISLTAEELEAKLEAARKEAHDSAFAEARRTFKDARARLDQDHTQKIEKLKAKHKDTLASVIRRAHERGIAKGRAEAGEDDDPMSLSSFRKTHNIKAILRGK